jgi:aspartyl-tRNA(Asn)/glutamyl-tRNA(Gln) amidotransferase subunit A
MLKNFRAPIDATVVRKLKESGAIIMGQTNMDEFGMGSFGIKGYEGSQIKNPIDEAYCAGGSSAGSASATKSY